MTAKSALEVGILSAADAVILVLCCFRLAAELKKSLVNNEYSERGSNVGVVELLKFILLFSIVVLCKIVFHLSLSVAVAFGPVIGQKM